MIHITAGRIEYRGWQMSNDDTWLASLAGAVLSRESAALAALVGAVESSVVAVARQMLDVPGKVVTTGSGTSGIMAERLAHLLSVCGTPAVYLPSMDALHGGMGAITTSDLVVAISKTGQSRELISLVERLAQRGIDVVAVTESPDSPFAVAAASVAALPPTPADADPGDMIAMASTLAVGAWSDAVAVLTMAMRGHTVGSVVDSHPAGGVGVRGHRPGDESAPVVRA
jgi:D-arabinose 5-phosphate isomerase GutQ